MPELIVAKPDGTVLHQFSVGTRTTVTIGRTPSCQIVVPASTVSRRHGLVFEHRGRWHAVDLDSTTGMMTAAGSVRRHCFTPEHAWIGIGPIVVWLDQLQAAGPANALDQILPRPRRGNVVAVRPVPVESLPTQPNPTITPLMLAFRRRGDLALQLVDLASVDRLVIGGAPDCDIILPNDEVPLRALVFQLGSKWAIVDLVRSSVDRAAPGYQRLRPGLRWGLGDIEAVFLEPETLAQRGPRTPDSRPSNDLRSPRQLSCFVAPLDPEDDDETVAAKKP
jgi:hypothetical protein